MRPSEDTLEMSLNNQDERATANGRCVAFMRQAYPNMAVMTYDNRVGRGADHLLLTKFVVGIGKKDAPDILSYTYCTEQTTADNVPGGLVSRALTTDGDKVVTEIYPAILPEEDAYHGAAVIRIVSDRPGIFLRFGCGNVAFMHHSPNPAMKGPDIDCESGYAVLTDTDGCPCVEIGRDERDFVTFVRGDMDFTVRSKQPTGSYAEGYTPENEVCLCVGFATDKDRALALSRLSPADEIEKIRAFYQKKFENLYVHTPDADLDGAFTHAYLNLEYSWLYPLGWIECIQHWPTMFHMEQTAAEEWAGNAVRAKETLLSQLKYMQDNGAVIELHPNHTGRRDWGGENHFFMREMMHYLRMTGDQEFARACLPYVDKIMKQTFDEYDAERTGILKWHSQIGNQEDFESTPGHGAAPGAEGVRMLQLASEFYTLTADPEKARRYAAASEYAKNAWYKKLWKKDLGRAVWFADDYGEERLDTTYHGILYPIIYGQVDSFDAASSLDHLTHRMTGEEGEVFQSNHFGDHRFDWVPTWGMQAGSNMQPFATAGYALTGRCDEAVRPLDFVARRVCGPYQRGSFPETANETRFGYFSPSAGVFAQSVIEDIFGIRRDVPGNTLTVSPCFPKNWDSAEICLPSLGYTYTKTSDGHGFTLVFDAPGDDATEKKLIWRTDLLKSVTVSVNGKIRPSAVTYEWGFCTVTCDMGVSSHIELTVEAVPLSFELNYDRIAVCGEKFNLSVTGAELLGLYDRCGLFDGDGRYSADLMDAYVKMGDFGTVNFARRTFGVRLLCDGIKIGVPCSVTVVPPYVIGATYRADTSDVLLSLENRTGRLIDADVFLVSGAIRTEGHIVCQPGGNAQVCLACDGVPVPGQNRAHLTVIGVWSGEITLDAPRTASVIPLDMPPRLTVPYADWRGFAYFTHHGCTVINPDAFMRDLPGRVSLGGIDFELCGGFCPVATRSRRVLCLPIDKKARKLFVLFSAFADDHEICSRLFTAEVVCKKGDAYTPPVYRKDLYFPGDLDYGFGADVDADFSTFKPGASRPSVLPELGNEDYADTVPPLYPSRDLWCKNLATEVGNTVFNLLEFDLGETRDIETLTFIANASDAAGGVFGLACL